MYATTAILRTSRTAPAATARLLHTTPAHYAAGKDPQLSQGTANKPGRKSQQPDPHSQSARSGFQASGAHDAASSRAGDMKTDRSDLSGNPEGVGFADQVGSASASGNKFSSPGEGVNGREESTPPGFFASVKSALGLSTSAGEVKQNRGGGVGVTGTGALPFERKPQEGRRVFHMSAVRGADPTTGQAPDASRRPKERTNAEQNEHLTHRSADEGFKGDKGKGNAADTPTLPSKTANQPKPGHQQKRAFSSTAIRPADKHTAESYFKDVDNSPPANEKTHQVDSSSTGSDVQRPNEQPTGEFSRAGTRTKEYENVSEDKPYDVPAGRDEHLQYGGHKGLDQSQNDKKSTSKPGEGPEGASKGGRKPESK